MQEHVNDVKESVICGWKTTVLGLGVLAVCGVALWLNPGMRENPLTIVPLATALFTIFKSKE